MRMTMKEELTAKWERYRLARTLESCVRQIMRGRRVVVPVAFWSGN
jgi:hypothetical protein